MKYDTTRDYPSREELLPPDEKENDGVQFGIWKVELYANKHFREKLEAENTQSNQTKFNQI